MSTAATVFDVFLSFAAKDSGIADAVASRLSAAGLNVFHAHHAIALGEPLEEAIWDAMAESDAVIVIATPNAVSAPQIAFEAGAAAAWEKPVLVLRSDVRPSQLPSFLRKYQSFSLADVDRIGRQLAKRQRASQLSETEIEALAKVYQQFDVPTDRLATEPNLAKQVAQQFNRATKSQRPSGEVVRQLLRLRKAGRLPRLRSTSAN